MEGFEENGWDLGIDYVSLMDVDASPAFSWVNHRSGVDIDFSQTGSWPIEQEYSDRECSKKRARTEASSKPSTKAGRERLRREMLSDRFLYLSSILEPGRATKTDKLAILNDTIRIVNQLRTESQEYKEENRKLKEEIEILKAEKNELREEKLTLKAEKERMEQHLNLKATGVPSPGMMSPYSAPYPTEASKRGVYLGYGMVPMWHYLPPSTRDTSRDHELRPPAA